MDTSLINAQGNSAQTAYARPYPVPVGQTVATDLAPSQTVTAASDSQQTSDDLTRPTASTTPPSSGPTASGEVLIDPATREVIYRVVDVRSGQVVGQVPDKALLGMRVYAHEISQGNSPEAAATKTELDLQA